MVSTVILHSARPELLMQLTKLQFYCTDEDFFL